MENTHTNQINIIELFNNNTWTSVHSNRDVLRGKWNLYNDTNNINTNRVSKMAEKNIWISLVPKKFIVILRMISCFWVKLHNLASLAKVVRFRYLQNQWLCRVLF